MNMIFYTFAKLPKSHSDITIFTEAVNGKLPYINFLNRPTDYFKNIPKEI